VTVETGRGEGTVWLAVEDSGVGIAEDFLESLFEPFAQEDARVNRAFEGTGLGLAIASRLARQMGGRLEVQSRKDAGSRFTLVLPAA
jgi:signal transduction histidine kinase